MLYLHCSRYPQQASASLGEEIKASLTKGKRVYLLVPSQFTVEAEIFLFQSLGTDILYRAQVKSFASLEREILQASSDQAGQKLTELGRRMLLRMVLEEVGGDLEAIQETSFRDQFVQGLLDQIKEFKDYDLAPKDLEALTDQVEDSPKLRAKLQDLAHIYAAYEGRLDQGFEDSNDSFRSAFNQLGRLDIFQDVDFYLDGFHSLSQMELDALQAISAQGSPIHLALTLDPSLAKAQLEASHTAPGPAAMDRLVPDAQVFSFSLRFLKKIQSLDLGEIEFIDASQAPAHPDEDLARIADNTFSYQVKKTEAGGKLKIRQYRNIEAEVDGLILEIKKKIMDEKVQLGQIQIVLTEPEEYGDLVKARLEKEGLSYFYDEVRSIGYHPLVRLVRSLLDFMDPNFRPEDAVGLLKTGLLIPNMEDVEVYQNFIKRRKIRHSMFFDPQYFTLDENFAARYPQEREEWEAEYAKAREVNQVLLESTAGVRECFNRDSSCREKLKALVDFLLQDRVQTCLKLYEQDLLDKNHLEKLEEHQQVWDALMDLFDELYQISDDQAMDGESFTEILKEGVRGLSLGIIPPYQDCILISSLTRSRSLPRDYVFIPGMADEYIPKPGQGSKILSDSELGLLRDRGYFLPSMPDFQAEEERLNFYTAMVQARKGLYFSWPMKAGEDQELEESYWLKQVEGTVKDLDLETVLDFSLGDLVYSKQLAERLLPLALKSDDPTLVKEAEEFLQKMDSCQGPWQDLAQKIRDAGTYSNQRPDLSMDIRQHFFLSQLETSASELESYAACPYRYFIQYVLRPKEEKEIDLDPRDRGQVIHGGIDAWAHRLVKANPDLQAIDPDQSRQVLLASYQDQVDQYLDPVKKRQKLNSLLLNLLEKTLLDNHRRILNQIKAGSMSRMETELAFGKGNEVPALPILQAGEGDLSLRGRVDRLDFFTKPDGGRLLQLVDYKTGKKTMDQNRLYGGLDLQLPLYVSAVRRQYPGDILGFFYFQLLPFNSLKLVTPDQSEDPDKKEGKLDGCLLLDKESLDLAEPDLWEKNQSEIYQLKGRGRLEKKRNLLDQDQMEEVLDHAMDQARRSALDRNAGKISPHPFRIETGRLQTACSYCPYGSICRFEKEWQFGDYRFIQEEN